MPYLVVLIVDNSPHHKGDVISWRPEGSQNFGTKMLEHPWFRVIHCPDMTEDEAESLTTPEPGDSLVNPNLNNRAFKLDLPELEKKPDTPEDAVMAYSEIKRMIRRK